MQAVDFRGGSQIINKTPDTRNIRKVHVCETKTTETFWTTLHVALNHEYRNLPFSILCHTLFVYHLPLSHDHILVQQNVSIAKAIPYLHKTNGI